LLSINVNINVHRNSIPVVVYGCETWPLTLLRAIGNSVLRKIFGPQREDVRGEWTRLYNEEINNL
jgi:hypothetical protein